MFFKRSNERCQTTVHFADMWGEFFENCNMRSYDDFFRQFELGHDGDETKSKKSKSDVQMFTAGGEDCKKTFFLKRFRKPTFKTTLRALMQSGKLMSRGKVEWSNANFLLSNGIGAYKPVCYGEITIFGFEVESFVITEKLEMQELDEFVINSWKSLPLEEQKNIIIKIAKTVRQAHSLNVSIRDLYLKHIFIEINQGEISLSFIDLENVWQNVRSPFTKVRDLGRLYFSMGDEYFDKDSKELLLDTYLTGVPSLQKGVMEYLITSRAKKRLKRQLEKEQEALMRIS